jgi:hypothetical protein
MLLELSPAGLELGHLFVIVRPLELATIPSRTKEFYPIIFKVVGRESTNYISGGNSERGQSY